MPKRSFGQHLGAWDRLLASIERNADDAVLRHHQEIYRQLREAVEQARKAKQRQLKFRAKAQQATRDLEAATEKANDAAVRLHQGVISTYGTKSEKLTEFGLRPWRSRRRKAAPEAREAGEGAAPAGAKPRKPR